jgi:hypothetical protein
MVQFPRIPPPKRVPQHTTKTNVVESTATRCQSLSGRVEFKPAGNLSNAVYFSTCLLIDYALLQDGQEI